MNRRRFLAQGAGAAALPSLYPLAGLWQHDNHISCNLYTWLTYYRREGKDFYADIDAGLAAVASSGVDGIEPSITSTDQVDEIAPLLEKHGLKMRSIYVNSKFHEAGDAEDSIAQVLKIADSCKALGTKIIVINPSPLGWNSPENKTDAQLRVQAVALQQLGAELYNRGLTLAYHTHDSEFRAGAREFHHMMLSTNPRHVTFCLDVHWVYRGSENSNVALFDVIDLYGERISELHIRQSLNHIWTETFGEGDIDYASVVEVLRRKNLRPFLVLEQAAEEGTPATLSPVEVHRVSQKAMRKIFAPLG
ncbi:MAG: sugar phosphate isomerase/epimerase [Bacteroidota bacterium]